MDLLDKVNDEVELNREDMVAFMRDLIRIPGESCQEKEVIKRIEEEMKKVGFNDVFIDPLGNILGKVGSGKRIIGYDAHVDTVGVGDPEEWKWDPYEGKIENDVIYGRGATDQLGAMVSMVYAGQAISRLGLHEEFTLYFVGSVQEEDCDGLCWNYIINENKIIPELVVITEPTNLNIYRGHRGRIEMKVTTSGVSCHASAPERGENSVYRMAPIIEKVEELNPRIKDDKFLGKGTIAVTHITNETPSLNAVPNKTTIYLDRRLTAGEDRELALGQVRDAVKEAGQEAEVEILQYEKPSYTGLVYPMEKYYPTWVVEEDHHVIKSAVKAYRHIFNEDPYVDKWTFSTNGIAIMGLHGIPCIGFGPGNEVYAHSVNEQVPVGHLVKACIFYSIYPHYL